MEKVDVFFIYGYHCPYVASTDSKSKNKDSFRIEQVRGLIRVIIERICSYQIPNPCRLINMCIGAVNCFLCVLLDRDSTFNPTAP